MFFITFNHKKKVHWEKKIILNFIVIFLFLFNTFYFIDLSYKECSFKDHKDFNKLGNSQSDGGLDSWYITWGGFDSEYGYSVALDSEINVYIAGYIRDYKTGNEDLLLTKFNSSGYHLWNITWGGSERETYGYTAVDSKDYVYLTGYKHYGTNLIDLCLIKYNNSGQIEWEKILEGNTIYSYIPLDIAIDSEDDIFITGYRYNIPSDTVDLLIVKYNNSGYQLWNATWDGGYSDVGRGIAFDSEGNIYITGSISYFITDYRGLLVKYNRFGIFQWNQTWGIGSGDHGRDIIIDLSDNIYIAGVTKNSSLEKEDLILIKFNKTGNQEWNKTWGGSEDDMARSLNFDSNGDIYITGQTDSFGRGSHDIICLKYNISGYLEWSKIWGGTRSDSGFTIISDSSNNTYIAGISDSFGDGSADIILIKNIYFLDPIENNDNGENGTINDEEEKNIKIDSYEYLGSIIALLIIGVLIIGICSFFTFSGSRSTSESKELRRQYNINISTTKKIKKYKLKPNYRNEYWLRTELALRKTISQIAYNEGVLEDTIKKWIRHFGIEYQKPKDITKEVVKKIPISIKITCPHCNAIYTENIEICEKCGAEINIPNEPMVCSYCYRITKPILDNSGKHFCEFCKSQL